MVVADADSDRGAGLARAVAEAGAAVVLTGRDAERIGALAAELADARVAVFLGEPTDAAFAEMLDELSAP